MTKMGKMFQNNMLVAADISHPDPGVTGVQSSLVCLQSIHQSADQTSLIVPISVLGPKLCSTLPAQLLSTTELSVWKTHLKSAQILLYFLILPHCAIVKLFCC